MLETSHFSSAKSQRSLDNFLEYLRISRFFPPFLPIFFNQILSPINASPLKRQLTKLIIVPQFFYKHQYSSLFYPSSLNRPESILVSTFLDIAINPPPQTDSDSIIYPSKRNFPLSSPLSFLSHLTRPVYLNLPPHTNHAFVNVIAF